MKTVIVTIVLLLTFASQVAAQNPCTTPPGSTTVSATPQFYATLTDHAINEPDGTPRVASYSFAAWPAATDPNATPPPTPAQGPSTIPKTAFEAVAGFANCYRLPGGLPGLIPTTAPLRVGLRATGSPSPTEPARVTSWGVSNPFQLPSPRVTPATPVPVIRP